MAGGPVAQRAVGAVPAAPNVVLNEAGGNSANQRADKRSEKIQKSVE
jgi:hypothetical protein